MSTPKTSCSCDACGSGLCFGDVLCSTCGAECDPDKTRGFTVDRDINRGDTTLIDFTLTDENGSGLDLSLPGVKVWFTVNPVIPRIATDPVLWQGTLVNAGVVALIPAAGKIRVIMPATVTQYLADGIEKLYYDLQVLDGNGRVTTVEKGRFFVSPDITRAVT